MKILISGTSKGIGRYLAEYYSKDPGNTVFGCSRSDAGFDSNNYTHFKLDISQPKDVSEMFSTIRRSHGSIDVLINNAGINITPSPFMLVPPEKMREVFDVNFFAAVNMCRESVKLMMSGSFGRIINIGSMAVKHEVEGETIYTASKSALTSFTRVLAKEVFKMGITCNMVSPSAIETDLSENINKEALQEVLNRNAINEYGIMEDVSNTIDWLILPTSGSVTGQVIYLGGV